MYREKKGISLEDIQSLSPLMLRSQYFTLTFSFLLGEFKILILYLLRKASRINKGLGFLKVIISPIIPPLFCAKGLDKKVLFVFSFSLTDRFPN